jgi:hypothetical protein
MEIAHGFSSRRGKPTPLSGVIISPKEAVSKQAVEGLEHDLACACRTAGKLKKVAIVACSAKLLTILDAVSTQENPGTFLFMPLDLKDSCSTPLVSGKRAENRFLPHHAPFMRLPWPSGFRIG